MVEKWEKVPKSEVIKNKKKSKKRIGPKIRSGLKMRKSSTYNVIKKFEVTKK